MPENIIHLLGIFIATFNECTFSVFHFLCIYPSDMSIFHVHNKHFLNSRFYGNFLVSRHSSFSDDYDALREKKLNDRNDRTLESILTQISDKIKLIIFFFFFSSN